VFKSNDAPRYTQAFIAHIVVYGVQMATIVFLRLYLMRQNALKRRAQDIAPGQPSNEDAVGIDQFLCQSSFDHVKSRARISHTDMPLTI
jgi:hypothetical protein